MSAAPDTLSACPDVQAELDNYYATCNASNLREPMPFFDYLMSPDNRSGLQQLVVPSAGKIKTAQLTYSQRLLESEVTAPGTADLTCTATTKRGNLTHEVTIDETAGYEAEELMNANDWVRVCKDNPAIFAEKVQRLIDAVVRRTATHITTTAAALMGGWDSSVSVTANGGKNWLELATLDADGKINPLAFEDLDLAVMQSAFCAPPVVFSGTTFYKYARAMQAGCCSAQGLDLQAIREQYGKAVVYDRRVQATLSADKAWVVQPGALQIVTYNLADQGLGSGEVLSGSNYRKMTVFDPQSGLPVDILIKDDCGNVSVVARANAKITALPTDIFAPGDNLAEVNFFAGLLVNNA